MTINDNQHYNQHYISPSTNSAAYDITLSIGDGLRPGCIAGAQTRVMRRG